MPELNFTNNNGIAFFDYPEICGITTRRFGNTENAGSFESFYNERMLQTFSKNIFFKISAEHSSKVCLVATNGKQHNFVSCDALLYVNKFQNPPMLLANTADCPIIAISSSGIVNKVLALVHSGREGTKKNITAKVINQITENDIDLEELLIAIWPGICPHCYTIYPEHLKILLPYIPAGEKKPSLASIIYGQLIAAGINEHQIYIPDQTKVCSAHTTDEKGNFLFSSYRRETDPTFKYSGEDKRTHRNMVFLG